ncbi:S-layer protein domain-containing protein [Methanolobus mangrovi]|uniref:S-layer protein domain-containing protein n=1 Tax=Methanolobus mangrovi TaxID=3072977 RepID=A0AA51UGW5_9EURY|nr:S-layer protein domain-containing protein [Methanolobus mangrovi]WMW22993.1 S-layer protein domain-containing protein [Methanolobus mangrovi]
MNIWKQYKGLTLTLVLFLTIVFSCGCIAGDEPVVSESINVNNNTSGVVPEDFKVINESNEEKMLEIDSTSYTTALKKTAILELENGYSLKVLDVDKQEERILVSLRKDGNEYATRTMLTGHTYSVKDTKDQNVIYSIHVDEIFDNSFVVELTYTIKPEILLETEVYEGKVREIEVRINEDTISRTYRWEYENTEFTVEYEYNIEAYDTYSERSRYRDYTHFVNDPYDDLLISQITTQMGELADDAGYSRNEIPYIAMAFVQSLPYVSDSASSGYDEYTRFPFETLYHGGGDCEDSSILLASILYDMGYGVALIELPGHMAVGVKGDDNLEGSYYDYSGTRYYYLETTNSGWNVGVIPDEYINADATVLPITRGYPELRIGFSGTAKSNGYVSYVNLEIEVENVGSLVAEDLVIYATLESTTEGMVWDDLQTDTDMDLNVDDTVTYTVSNLHVPAGEKYRVGIWAWDSNANSEYVFSDWTTA